jgi:hypothetical protein
MMVASRMIDQDDYLIPAIRYRVDDPQKLRAAEFVLSGPLGCLCLLII